jgi:MerR family transcriptional regulator/heat shock protein HspR
MLLDGCRAVELSRPLDLYQRLQVSYSPDARQNQDMAENSRGVFAISVAAEMVSMQIQNLRVYERRGLVDPDRTAGGTRLYSRDDIDRLHRIRQLLAEGLNLAGIAHVLRLEGEVDRLRSEVGRLRG